MIPLPAGSIGAALRSVQHLEQVHKTSLRPGDCLIVKTLNSTYTLCAQSDGDFLVSGGWFDTHEASPATIRINGCTWGGCMIKTDIAAAVGLCLEFGNRVTTSPIRKIIVIRRERQN